ncbi:hypothetical protein KM043_017450 [Ampulex compressa]|nr:hypothetical protein KM043_017450 [Ampulex compressa]
MHMTRENKCAELVKRSSNTYKLDTRAIATDMADKFNLLLFLFYKAQLPCVPLSQAMQELSWNIVQRKISWQTLSKTRNWTI